MKQLLLLIIILLPLVFVQLGCGGAGGGGTGDSGGSVSGGENGDDTGIDNPNPVINSFGISDLSLPDTVQKNGQTTVSADITGKVSEIILFQFLSNNGKSHMVPNSGIIATKNNTGQVKLVYHAPAQTGKHYYYLKVLNSDGEEIIKEFYTTVVD